METSNKNLELTSMTSSELINELINFSGLDIDKLAERLKVSKPAIRNIICGCSDLYRPFMSAVNKEFPEFNISERYKSLKKLTIEEKVINKQKLITSSLDLVNSPSEIILKKSTGKDKSDEKIKSAPYPIMSTSEIIKELMRIKGSKNLGELSKLIGIPSQTLSNYILRKYDISSSVAKKLDSSCPDFQIYKRLENLKPLGENDRYYSPSSQAKKKKLGKVTSSIVPTKAPKIPKSKLVIVTEEMKLQESETYASDSLRDIIIELLGKFPKITITSIADTCRISTDEILALITKTKTLTYESSEISQMILELGVFTGELIKSLHLKEDSEMDEFNILVSNLFQDQISSVVFENNSSIDKNINFIKLIEDISDKVESMNDLELIKRLSLIQKEVSLLAISGESKSLSLAKLLINLYLNNNFMRSEERVLMSILQNLIF